MRRTSGMWIVAAAMAFAVAVVVLIKSTPRDAPSSFLASQCDQPRDDAALSVRLVHVEARLQDTLASRNHLRKMASQLLCKIKPNNMRNAVTDTGPWCLFNTSRPYQLAPGRWGASGYAVFFCCAVRANVGRFHFAFVLRHHTHADAGLVRELAKLVRNRTVADLGAGHGALCLAAGRNSCACLYGGRRLGFEASIGGQDLRSV